MPISICSNDSLASVLAGVNDLLADCRVHGLGLSSRVFMDPSDGKEPTVTQSLSLLAQRGVRVCQRKIKKSQRRLKVCEQETVLPSRYDKAQGTQSVQQSRGLLEESRHLRVLVDGTLDRQEAPVQLVNQTHVNHVAGINTEEDKKYNTVNEISCKMLK